ncbi:hypothetical protein M8J76_005057 [Diaphorina citri]|nr:hypothetical protein M8J76_005057 [Diaphorina citri]
MGISRSSTCILAYLILKKKFRLTEALRLLRQSRDVRPNYGFLRQLAYLDNQLNRSAARKKTDFIRIFPHHTGITVDSEISEHFNMKV